MPAMDYSKVAHLYDAYANTQLDVPFFLQESKGADEVLELMSGTGRVSLPLIRAGVRLTCVDSSQEMLTVLRRKLAEEGLAASLYEMEVCSMSLAGPFDLVFIPFHSFSEILEPGDQRGALEGIRAVLPAGGRFICTLHNPRARLATVNGQLVQRGRHPLTDGSGTLFLSAIEHYHPGDRVVRGTQFYEIYDREGHMVSKTCLDIQFYLHEVQLFRDLVQSAGFRVLQLHGDYRYAPFQEESSPFMIWILGRAGE